MEKKLRLRRVAPTSPPRSVGMHLLRATIPGRGGMASGAPPNRLMALEVNSPYLLRECFFTLFLLLSDALDLANSSKRRGGSTLSVRTRRRQTG